MKKKHKIEQEEIKKEESEVIEESRIAEMEKERDEAKDKYLRLMAEFENFRRRNIQERAEWIKNANKEIVLKICDVMDDFERALKTESGKETGIYKGMESIFKKLEKVLSEEKVRKIETEEKEFDPMYHEAIAYQPSKMGKDMITGVIQNGYIMNDKIIRAAKVVLSSGEEVE